MTVAWREWYRRIHVPAPEALAAIRPGDRIFLSSACAEPQTIVDALVAEPARLDGTTVYQMLRGTRGLLAPLSQRACFRLVPLTPEPRARAAMAQGSADYFPATIYQLTRWIDEGLFAVDVAIVQVTPPDDDGNCSFGISVDLAGALAERARVVIAEVNEQMPRTLGETSIHVTKFQHAVVASRPLLELSPAVPDSASRQVAARVAELVPHGATIQIGVGSIPDAVLEALADHRDLGVHTGLITEAMLPLFERGVLTGARKSIDRGKAVTNQIRGTARFYRYVNCNPAFLVRPASYTHDPAVLRSIDNLVAINSALQVDLRGQANAESIRGQQVAGVGGSVDFVRAAQVSRGGRSIIALRSTSSDGATSRITVDLADNPVVTIHQVDADYVVTEHGVAALRGKTRRERADALIAIAHPDFRPQLRAAL